MQFIHFLYVIAAALSICAGVPQLRRLLLTKQSEEFSLSTWLMWMISQMVCVFYAVSVHDHLYAVVSSIWFAFYAIMAALIYKYRTVPDLEAAEESETYL